MDLAKFAQMPRDKGFLKFTANDNVKIIRFLYGTTVGVDEELGIPVRYQEFDQATKTVVYDTPGSKPTMSLRVAVYTSKNEYTIRTWSRRADTFGADILIPLWEGAGGRICDTVYKVTCTKAGTLDAKFSFFPLKDSDTYAMPDLSEKADDAASAQPQVQQQQYAPQGYALQSYPQQQYAPPIVSNYGGSGQVLATPPAQTVAQPQVQATQPAPAKPRKNFWDE